MTTICYRALLITVVAFLWAPTKASAQAYCKLRDPVNQIKVLYPNSEDYRSIVRTVDNDARKAVADALPFELHFNELGRHTLYVAQEGRRPVGLIHARSEAGRWGLVEIVWALDLDLRVDDFTFQRCRSPQRDVIESDEFKALLRGKSLEELGELITSDGERLQGQESWLSPDAMELGLAVVRSAMKTVVVTQHVWEADLPALRLFGNVMGSFEQADSIDLVKNVYNEAAMVELERRGIAESSFGIDRAAVEVLLVLNVEKELIGLKISTPWDFENERRLLWWTLTPERQILEVVAVEGWPSQEIADAFAGVAGMSPQTKSEDCSTFAGLIACEVIIIAATR